jgi:hypothetical protein
MATRVGDWLCLSWANAEWESARSQRGVRVCAESTRVESLHGVSAGWESARSQRGLRVCTKSSILRHSGIWRVEDGAVLNRVREHKKSKKIPPVLRFCTESTRGETLLSLSQRGGRSFTGSTYSDRSSDRQRCQQYLARFAWKTKKLIIYICTCANLLTSCTRL